MQILLPDFALTIEFHASPTSFYDYTRVPYSC